MRRTAVISMSLLIIFSACTRRPKGVLSDKEMAPVVADLELAEAYLQNNPQATAREDTREALISYAIEKNGVSREEFDSTMAYYARNVDEYVELYKLVDQRLAKKRKSMTGVATTADDSANDFWPYSRHSVISAQAGSNALIFNIPAGSVEKGDRIVWKLRMRTQADGQALFGVEYENGSRGYLTRQLPGNRRLEMTFQTDTARQVKSIFGYMTVDDSGDLPLFIDSISMKTLPLDTMEYYNIHSQRRWLQPARKPKPKPVETPDADETADS